MGVRVWVGVDVGAGVRVKVGVLVGCGVRVGAGVTVGLGASPVRVNRPDDFHSWPTNTWTSYSPGCHISGEALHSLKPYPPVLPFQGIVSKQIKVLSDKRYHKAVHCAPASILS